MTETTTCTSCTMPIESGDLCQYCGDEHGDLRPFPEIFERMVQWSLENEPELERQVAEQKTIAFMASMPAWRENSELLARRSG